MIGYVNEETIVAMCDAVREKLGTTDAMDVASLASHINSFKGGVDSRNYNAYINRTIVNAYSNAVPYIGSGAFFNCQELVSISFPNAENFYHQCFSNCPNLQYVDLPSAQLIEPQVFHYDTLLSYVRFTKPGLELQTQAFGHCSNLNTVDLTDPYKIWGEVFYDCSNLYTVIIRYTGAVADIPILSYPCFQGTPIEAGTGYIYVPRDLISTYQASANWSTYSNQFRAIEDYGY